MQAIFVESMLHLSGSIDTLSSCFSWNRLFSLTSIHLYKIWTLIQMPYLDQAFKSWALQIGDFYFLEKAFPALYYFFDALLVAKDDSAKSASRAGHFFCFLVLRLTSFIKSHVVIPQSLHAWRLWDDSFTLHVPSKWDLH